MRGFARSAVGAVALAWALAGCGSSERARPPAVAPADAGPAPAVRVEVPALGTDRLDGWGWRRGPGAAAFGRALAAERAGDLPTLEREATAALAADPGHLEAAWLAAVARARLGRLDEVLAPLQVAAAGDWGKWGERSLELAALEAFRASAAGRGWVEAAGRHRDAYQEALRRAVVVLGARVGERGAVGRELYAVDVEAGRWLRLTRTGGAVAGAIAAAGAPWIAYATVRKGARGGRVDVRIAVVDRTTGRAGREVAFDDVAAVTLAWRPHDGEVALHAAVVDRAGKGRGAVVDWRRGAIAPVAAPRPLRGERLEIAADGVALRRLPIARVSADWDDATASAVRFDRSGKVVAAPAGGLIDGDSLALDPGGARAAFVTAPEPPCEPTTPRAAYAVEVTSGRLRPLARGAVAGPVWLDDERVAVTVGDQVEVISAASGVSLATLAGGAGVATLTAGPRRSCAAPPPPFVEPDEIEPDEIDADRVEPAPTSVTGDAAVDASASPGGDPDAGVGAP
jgi:hypothetical protein